MSRYNNVKQHDITDCGPCCIATICLDYKKEVTITKLRELSGTDSKGTTLKGMVAALEKLNFYAKSIKVTSDAFDTPFTLPCIARVITQQGLTHFVVIEKIKKDIFIISDPDKGIVKKSKEEFLKEFDGYLILTYPDERFIMSKDKTKSVFSRFVKLLLNQKGLFITAIIGSIVLTALGIISSFFSKILMDEILPYNLKNQLLIFCIGFGVLGLFNVLLGAFRSHLLLHLSIRIDKPLTLGYFSHIFKLPMKFFGTRRTGDILTRFQDASTIKDIFTTITLSLLIDILLTIVSGIILVIMNWKLFLVILVLTIISGILVYVFKQPYKKLNKLSMEKQSMLNSTIIDSLKGIETIKSFGKENKSMDNLEEKYIDALKIGYKTSVTSNIQGSISGIISGIGNIVLMGIACLLVIDGEITLGSMMAFMSLSSYFMDPIGRLISLQLQIQEASIAMKRMSELYEVEEEQENNDNLIKDFILDGNININNVSFRYGSHKLVLNDINMKINNLDKVALVGLSGGGKSTLAKLILGLYKPEIGNIKISNMDIEEVDKKILRNEIAYVPQNVELFSDSILNNIKLGKDDATLDEVKDAATLAGCSNFINLLPAKYNTYLEEAGNNLSGGERQRIALARALIKKPKVLILDEATSNLDFISESNIYETLFKLDCTLIIIAHRLSTIRRCNKVYVLDDSKIVEEGSHQQLLNKKGLYYKIYTSQVGVEEKVTKHNKKEIVKEKDNQVDDNEMSYS